MINLFERFDKRTERLWNSLELAGIKNSTVILEDDGFLPDAMMSPYRFFAHEDSTTERKALYFNGVKIPKYWDIEGDNTTAVIKDMEKIRAHIQYHPYYQSRIVQYVEWLNDANQISYIDIYNKKGIRFAQMIKDSENRFIFKKFYNAQGHEIMYYNFVTDSVFLSYQNKNYLFGSKMEFIQFFLKEWSGHHIDQMVINTLSIPLKIAYNGKMNTHVFWQEYINQSLPANLDFILSEEDCESFKVLIPDKKEKIKVNDLSSKRKAIQSGYIYPFARKNEYSKNILIVTNSDQILNLDSILKGCPQHHFYIAAITEMSSKLMDFEKEDNITLLPNCSSHKIKELFHQCDIYLDINQGNEIENAIETAFLHHLLILAFSETMHQPFFTAEVNRFESVNYDLLIDCIHSLDNKEVFKNLLKEQCEFAHAVSVETFKQSFNSNSFCN